jgi:hypothetical protein
MMVAPEKMFRLSSEAGFLGLVCGKDGLALAGVPLIRGRDGILEARPWAEIRELISRAYNVDVEDASLARGLDVIAHALNRGDMARAMTAAVLLKLPELDWDGAVCIARAEDGLTKFNPDQPRDSHGRWVAGDGNSSDEGNSQNGTSPAAFPASIEMLSEHVDSDTVNQIVPARLDLRNFLFGKSNSTEPPPATVRANIAQAATSQIGSQDWADKTTNGNFGPGTNKCNKFVYDILTQAGASPGLPNGYFGTSPPSAGQWADPNYSIPNWPVLPTGISPAPGDVVAQRIPYTDASGHVMIVGPNNTFIGTGNPPNAPQGTIEQIPARSDLGHNYAGTGPLVYRRYKS